MPRRKNTVKIEEGKVIFSKEILEYFESLRNEETSEWIDKYFEVLSDCSNFDALKFNIHHIKPVFTFKTEELNTRKKSEKVANEFPQNMIKLSIYNHIMAHFYLWKIYNNQESKIPLNYLFKTSKSIDELNEEELKEIAKLIEEFSKTNKSRKEYYEEHKEEHKERSKKYREENKEPIKQKKKEYYLNNKEYIDFKNKENYQKNKEQRLKQNKKYRMEHKEEIKEKAKIRENIRNYRYCFDPRKSIKNTNLIKDYKVCYWRSLLDWANKNHELIKDLTPLQFANKYLLTESDLIKYQKDISDFENKIFDDRLKENTKERNRKKCRENDKIKGELICFDPRYNKIQGSNFYNTKFVKFKILYSWCKHNSNHELLNGQTPYKFACTCILSEEDLIKYKDEINNQKPKQHKSKEEIKKNRMDKNYRLCLDPRFDKIIVNNFNCYKFSKITNFQSLLAWAKNHPNHWLLNNLTPKEFANKYLLSEEDKIKYTKEIEEYLNSKKK